MVVLVALGDYRPDFCFPDEGTVSGRIEPGRDPVSAVLVVALKDEYGIPRYIAPNLDRQVPGAVRQVAGVLLFSSWPHLITSRGYYPQQHRV